MIPIADSYGIPKIIHQMWIGSEIPVEYLGYRAAWKTLHPDWEFMLWQGRDIDLRNSDLWDGAEQISPKAPWQYRADIARYEILHTYGGVWVDMDFKPQKPIDDLCGEGVYAWMAWEQEPPQGKLGPRGLPGYLNNAIMASTPGHPFLQEAIRLLPEGAKRKGANTVKSGPQFITPIALKYGVTTYPKDYFYPYTWAELDREDEEFPDAYGIHRWNNRRKRK